MNEWEGSKKVGVKEKGKGEKKGIMREHNCLFVWLCVRVLRQTTCRGENTVEELEGRVAVQSEDAV